MLDVNYFANSQDFNAVSPEINHRIESEVLPGLREKAAVGDTVRFVGCVEITNNDTDLKPPCVVLFIVDDTMTELGDIVLEARGIIRSFSGVKALQGVDLTLRSGRLTALLGENGAKIDLDEYRSRGSSSGSG